MNVGELKEVLNQFDDETPVLVATDEEGNSFHRLLAYGLELVNTEELEEEYDLNVVTAADLEEEYGDDVDLVISQYSDVVVLWP